MKKKIGLVTIGQSPREDVVPEIRMILGSGVEIFERGALDGLREKEIKKLGPGKDDFPLITRLRNGATAVVGRGKIIPLLREKIKGLEHKGVGLVALLCTDEFPELEPEGILLSPFRLLLHAVEAVKDKGKLGVFVPLEQQKEAAAKKWGRRAREVFVEVLNPYQPPPQDFKAAARMQKAGVDMIVLDCIGYSLETKRRIGRATGKPVLLPRTVLARVISELIGII